MAKLLQPDKDRNSKSNQRIIIMGMLLVPLLVGVAVLLIASIEPNHSSKVGHGDLDRDGIQETYVMNNGQLKILAGDKLIWRSPSAWKVTSFALADITNDHTTDLLIVLWKKGSFGRYRPFWHTGEDQGWSNHLFVYNLVKQKMNTRWCSSAVARPIAEISVDDVDGNGQNELIVREQTSWSERCQKLFGHHKLDVSVWQWQTFGFYKSTDAREDSD